MARTPDLSPHLVPLVVQDRAAYDSLALRLARNPPELADMRRRCADARKGRQLFDTRRTVRALEHAYDGMWTLHEQGRAPTRLRVPDDDQGARTKPA